MFDEQTEEDGVPHLSETLEDVSLQLCVLYNVLQLVVEELQDTWQGRTINQCILESPFYISTVTDTQPKTSKSKQCRCRSTGAKKPREEPGSEVWPVLFWLCWVEIIQVHVANKA